MKKEYIKPVMESEMFVANEYVSSCYEVVCRFHNEMITIQELPTKEQDDDDFFYSEWVGWVYTGDKLGDKVDIIGNKVDHMVNISEDKATPEHPNHS